MERNVSMHSITEYSQSISEVHAQQYSSSDFSFGTIKNNMYSTLVKKNESEVLLQGVENLEKVGD